MWTSPKVAVEGAQSLARGLTPPGIPGDMGLLEGRVVDRRLLASRHTEPIFHKEAEWLVYQTKIKELSRRATRGPSSSCVCPEHPSGPLRRHLCPRQG